MPYLDFLPIWNLKPASAVGHRPKFATPQGAGGQTRSKRVPRTSACASDIRFCTLGESGSMSAGNSRPNRHKVAGRMRGIDGGWSVRRWKPGMKSAIVSTQYPGEARARTGRKRAIKPRIVKSGADSLSSSCWGCDPRDFATGVRYVPTFETARLGIVMIQHGGVGCTPMILYTADGFWGQARHILCGRTLRLPVGLVSPRSGKHAACFALLSDTCSASDRFLHCPFRIRIPGLENNYRNLSIRTLADC